MRMREPIPLFIFNRPDIFAKVGEPIIVSKFHLGNFVPSEAEITTVATLRKAIRCLSYQLPHN